ncbi:dioxygenase [Roseisolibacter agri]|uniref:Dioxygenase n=2 Tax=Roseisolibacter agri TaxID=2014610 RepID=A0AA37Q773_9BACT|nr:dioxygenase [Roseisolibacter agri]
MTAMPAANPFDLTGRVAVVTGGTGVLGGQMAEGLARAGARVAVLGRRRDAGEERAAALRETGAEAMALAADVLDEGALRAARDEVVGRWGRVDILINAAGGNVARARTDGVPPFGMPMDAFDEVVKLNLHGSVAPSLMFGAAMAEQGKGSIVNISSMAAMQAISGVLGYSVAKAAIDNFTKWLAVDLARKCGAGLRVNAIAPGFFLAHQNRGVLVNEDGSYTDRAKTVIARTPMGRFGAPEELIGAVVFLCSDAASFVTGTVLPVDGGFSAFSGV